MEQVITDTRVSILWQALHEVSLKVSSPAARWNGNKIRNVQILGARQQENKIKLITSEPRGFYCIYGRFENVKTYVKRQIWERKKIRVPCKDRKIFRVNYVLCYIWSAKWIYALVSLIKKNTKLQENPQYSYQRNQRFC